MIELPEAVVLADQLSQTIKNKKISNVVAAHTPHGFAWFFGDPADYHNRLYHKTITDILPEGGHVELYAEDMRISFQDGVNLRFFAPGETLPKKHQILIEFEDGSALVGSVQMYGGMMAFQDGENDNFYYLVAKEKPSPLSDAFDWAYFQGLCRCDNFEKLSAKAFLATEQRIPGLGNGVLQDILWKAHIHPKRKMGALSENDLKAVFSSIKSTLGEMVLKGGRDTEKDLFGTPGGYQTNLSKTGILRPCPICGGEIKKAAYMGGSIYFCSGCQPI